VAAALGAHPRGLGGEPGRWDGATPASRAGNGGGGGGGDGAAAAAAAAAAAPPPVVMGGAAGKRKQTAFGMMASLGSMGSLGGGGAGARQAAEEEGGGREGIAGIAGDGRDDGDDAAHWSEEDDARARVVAADRVDARRAPAVQPDTPEMRATLARLAAAEEQLVAARRASMAAAGMGPPSDGGEARSEAAAAAAGAGMSQRAVLHRRLSKITVVGADGVAVGGSGGRRAGGRGMGPKRASTRMSLMTGGFIDVDLEADAVDMVRSLAAY
jgi:hypothetical protein